ncbi:ethionine resistance protein [Dimargaris xerosporica]|nr:ethionine resistance protein [Dimargaris xerosporica]
MASLWKAIVTGSADPSHSTSTGHSSTESTPILAATPHTLVPTRAPDYQTLSTDGAGPSPSLSAAGSIRSQDTMGEEVVDYWDTFKAESKILAKLTYPAVAAYLLQYSINVASVFSLGHLGPDELAASALASMFASVSGWAVGVGLISALDTLCSQSYTGARDVHAVGVYLQRGMVAIAACHLPILLLWWYSEALLLALNQDPAIARLAGTYLRCLMTGCLPNLWFECIKRYLQAQGIMHASTLVLCVVSPLNVLTNYALVWWEPVALGFIGAPIATSISYWLIFILIVLYTLFVDGYQAWGGFSRRAFDHLGQFMRLGIPGAIMVCSEWWAFECVSLIVSYLGNASLAAQSVIMTTSTLSYQIPQGLSVASSNRIGNLLGASRPHTARISGSVAITFAASLGLINSLFYLIVGNWWGQVFSGSAEVIVLVAGAMKMAALFQVCDGVSAVIGGIFRGQGKQKLGALLSLPAYYVIGVPLGVYLGFQWHLGIVGIWGGLSTGVFFICFSELYFYLRTDWDKEVARCQKRVGYEDTAILPPV